MLKRYGAIVAILACAWAVFRLSAHGANHLVYDDAFYYFTIARNLARGLGSTFDGVTRTNGYHPLWLGICALPYLFGLDDDGAARALLIASLAMLAAVALVLLRLIDARARSWPVALGLLAYLFSPWAVARLAGGLESPLVAVFVALLAARMDACWRPDGARARVIVSLLACGLFLSRTDGALLVPWLAAYALARVRTARAAIEIALAPTLVIGAYLLTNLLLFGTATQVSGDLKRVAPPPLGVVMALVTVAAPPLVIAALGRARLLARAGAFASATAPLAGYVASVVAYYEHMQAFAWPWYYVGPIVYGGALVALALADVAALEVRFARLVPIAAASVAALASLRMARGVGAPEQYAILDANVEAGKYLRAHMPEDAIYGSWDAGAIGYYSHRRVVNLDGEVAPPEYVRALKARDPLRWTRSQRFDFVINVVDGDDAPREMRKLAGSFLGDDRVQGGEVIQSWPFVFHGYTNRHAPGAHAMAVVLMRLP